MRFKYPSGWLLTVAVIIFLSGCSYAVKEYTTLFGPSAPRDRVLTEAEVKQHKYISFANEVQPILSQRCAVCHSCNDAPCQLNFTSLEGIDRGLSTEAVYNGARFTQQDPTRLDIDANNTVDWREMGFFPVLNERNQTQEINLENSLLYKTLLAKRNHPFPTSGMLSEEYDVGFNLKAEESFVHSQVCPKIENYDDFIKSDPQFGMPFAFPPLNKKEISTIKTWLKQGAREEPEKKISKKLQAEVDKWELFLNGSSNKERLMSRYLYEHLFLGHLYFKDISETDFFTLVRSKTASGKPIDLISTTRPYDDPQQKEFYYRFAHYQRIIVDKTHLPYALSNQRIKRYKELFLLPAYKLDALPSYETKLAANPFQTFVAIPAKNRYQFLLDDAQYFVGGFIKGAVCRGSIALSVIDDHFWVAFMDPDKSYISQDSQFIAKVSNKLRIPSEKENSATLLSVWATYKQTAAEYFLEKVRYLNNHMENKGGFNIDKIWDGDQTNENAALTVYRHYDSATVLKGFVGEVPKTGWVIDYPIFERIHYLLVAGFNIYGTVGHQLSTRLYMDFLRVEAELGFLAFLPIRDRTKIHKYWYRGTDVTEKLLKLLNKINLKSHQSQVNYTTDDPKKELFLKISQHQEKTQTLHLDYLNRCHDFPEKCKNSYMAKHTTTEEKSLIELSSIKGKRTIIFPNVTFLRIKVDGTIENDRVYTIIRNKAYFNTMSLTVSEDTRDKENDSLDVIPSFVGAYPNLFLEVDYKSLPQFIQQFKAIENFSQYDELVTKYGIRRTNPKFWESSDWFYKKHQYENKVYAGLFDLNRYKNR